MKGRQVQSQFINAYQLFIHRVSLKRVKTDAESMTDNWGKGTKNVWKT